MAVAFDAVGPSSSGATASGATTLSWTHTPGSAGVALVADAAIGVSPDTGFSASCALDPAGANTAMPSLGLQHVNNGTSGFEQLFGLANVSSGAHTVQVSVSGGTPTTIVAGSESYTGADTAAPFSAAQTAFGNSSTPSLGFTGSTSGNMVTGGMAIGTAGTITMSSGTQRWSNPFSGATGAGNSAGGDIAAGGTVTLTWSPGGTDFWAVVAVEVKAATAAGGGAARPGKTWLRRFHHRQTPPQIPGAATVIPPNGTPPFHLVVARRSAARAVWAGVVSRTTNLQNGDQPGTGLVRRRAAARGQWRGPAAVTTTNAPPAVTATVRLAHGLVTSRRPVGGLWGGAFTPTPNAIPVPVTPDHLVVARRAAARVVWYGTVTRTTNATPAQVVSGTAPLHLAVARRSAARVVWRGAAVPFRYALAVTDGLIRRRQPARAMWAGTITRTVNATPAQPVNGTPPDHLVVARRQATRVVWAGTVTRTTNAVTVNGTAPDHLVVARRTAARGYWRGNPAAPRTGRPATGGLTQRRRPAGGQWRGYVSRTTNAPPPPFLVARSTPSVADPRDGTTTVAALAASTPTVTDPRDGTASVTRSVTSAPTVTDPRDGTSGVT